MKTGELVLKISENLDDILEKIIIESEIRNITWDLIIDEKNEVIEIDIEDLSSSASIKADIEKEDLFCAAMSIKRDPKKNVIYEMSGLLAATLFNNLALSGLKQLAGRSSDEKIKKFFTDIKKKEEDI